MKSRQAYAIVRRNEVGILYVESLWGDFDFAQSDKGLNIIFKVFICGSVLRINNPNKI